MYLLDTNVVSELRNPRPHGAVLAWLQATPEAELHLSAVTLGEIQAGIELTREQDAAKAAEIEALAGSGGGHLQRAAHGWHHLPHLGAADASPVGHLGRGRDDCGHHHRPQADDGDTQRGRLQALRSEAA